MSDRSPRWMIADGPNGRTLAVDLPTRSAAAARLAELAATHPAAVIVRQAPPLEVRR